jgi:hypothetical protein
MKKHHGQNANKENSVKWLSKLTSKHYSEKGNIQKEAKAGY